MRKTILLALAAALSFSSVDAQDIMNLRMNRGELGIRGNVVELNEDNLYKKDYFRDDWTSRKWFRTDLRQFLQEEEGHVYTFTDGGNLRQVTYTRQGNKVSSTRCGYAKNGLLTSFLGEGYKIEGKYKSNSGEFNVYAEARSYSGKADLATANLKTANYKTDYPFAYKCRQQLSNDGLVLKSSYFNVDSTLARQTEYTYSAMGQIVEQSNKTFNADGKPMESVTSYTYDGHGLLIHKETRGAGGVDSYTYTNNAMGDCVEMQAEHPYGTETFTYQYEYDDNGNWTIRLTFKDNVFDYATLRALTYGKGAKDKAEEVEQEDAPADGDAYYNTYDATAAHDAAKAAKSGKKRFAFGKKKAETKAQVDATADGKATKAQKKAERKELEQQAKQIKKEAGQTTKEKAKAQTKADKKAAKAAGKEAVKQVKAQAKSERKQADKVAADKAKAMKQAAVASQKASQKEARAAAKAQEKAAKTAAKKASQQAKEAADEAARKAKQSADETEKATVKQAKERVKKQQQTEEKMAKMAAKADKAQAKTEEKAAKKAAKEAQKRTVKEARKAK